MRIAVKALMTMQIRAMQLVFRMSFLYFPNGDLP